jgi:predicted aconitase
MLYWLWNLREEAMRVGLATAETAQMRLTAEERALLDGERGEARAKLMRALILYAQTMGATAFAPVTAAGHIAQSCGTAALGPVRGILDELVRARVAAPYGFTANPRPLGVALAPRSRLQKLRRRFGAQAWQDTHEQQLYKLGLRGSRDFTCACYMEEVGNTPKYGDTLSWGEDAAVLYANAVLGARSHRNPAGFDLFGTLLGRTPLCGVLTDEGRKARCVVELDTAELPDPQLLGIAVGREIGDDIPCIWGLEVHLGAALEEDAKDYLKDFGAALAAYSGAGMFHVSHLTPEAVRLGDRILTAHPKIYSVNDQMLLRLKAEMTQGKKKKNPAPKLCFIGCPHLSFLQLLEWEARFTLELERQGKKQLGMTTLLSAAPQVLERYAKEEAESRLRLLECGAQLTSLRPVRDEKHTGVTNAATLCVHGGARFFSDDEIIRIAVKGGI